MRAVLDHCQRMPGGNGGYHVHVARVPRDMDRHHRLQRRAAPPLADHRDRAGAGLGPSLNARATATVCGGPAAFQAPLQIRDRLGQAAGSHVEGVTVDIDEDRDGVEMADHFGSGGKGVRRGQDVVAPLHADSLQSQVHRAGTGIDRDRVFRPEIVRKPLFELVDLGAGRNPSGLQDFPDLVQFSFTNIWQRERQQCRSFHCRDQSDRLRRADRSSVALPTAGGFDDSRRSRVCGFLRTWYESRP